MKRIGILLVTIIGMIIVSGPLLVRYFIHISIYVVDKGLDGFGFNSSERW